MKGDEVLNRNHLFGVVNTSCWFILECALLVLAFVISQDTNTFGNKVYAALILFLGCAQSYVMGRVHGEEGGWRGRD